MMDVTTFEQLLRTRHSVRRFRPDPVPRALVRRCLTMASLAPSAHNAQPWRFVAILESWTRVHFAEAMAADFRRDLEADGVPAERVEALVDRSVQMISQAPVAILLSLSMAEMDRYPDARRQAAEHDLAVQSVALAGGHLLLAAHAAGLGGVWLCAPRFCPETVRRVLGLAEDWEPQGLILLGYPAEPTPDEKQRKSLSDVLIWFVP